VKERSFVDRLIQLGRPTWVAGFAPPPAPIDAGLWGLDRRLRMPGGALLPCRTSLARLRSGGLLVISPPPVELGGLDGLAALGAVEHVLAPNPFHYLNVAAFLARHPAARFWAAPGLFDRVPGLPAGRELGAEAPSEWRESVDHALLGPTRGVSEVALFHRESASLILTDLAFNLVAMTRRFDRVAWRLAGMPAGFGPSRTSRTFLLRDRVAAAAFLERLLAWPFRRVVVAHGQALETDAASEFRRAFAAYLAPPDRD
jgi:Domain of unknown function (DUF4336)